MPEYLSPGVYIEEVNSGPRPIEGVGTACAAFVGFAPYSGYEDINQPVLITSWSQYVERFGLPTRNGRREPYMKGAYMPHAVRAYFDNGGQRCFVTRVAPTNTTPERPEPLVIKTSRTPARDALQITALPAPLTNEIEVTIQRDAFDEGGEPTFTMRVRMGDVSEVHPNLSLAGLLAAQGEGTAAAQEEQVAPQLPAQPSPEQPPPRQLTSKQRRLLADAQKQAQNSEQVTSQHEDSQNEQQDDQGEDQEDEQQNEPPEETPVEPVEPPLSAPAPYRLVSVLVEVTVDEAASELADRLPEPGVYYITIPQPTGLKKLRGRDLIGDAAERTGVSGMEVAEEVTILCCPDLMSPLLYGPDGEPDETRVRAVHEAMIAHCERMTGRFVILDPPPRKSPQKMLNWRKDAGYNSKVAALYYPWVTIENPLQEDGEPKTIDVPPCGHIAGIYARNDSERGVHKAPANEPVRGIVRVAHAITKGEQDVLNPAGVNCLRVFSGSGPLVWGARTLSADPAWRYVNVRRLFNYIEKSLERGTQWVVFEPNNHDLWARVRRDVGAFLTGCWRDGMLFGQTPEQAFYVKCDEELNPSDVRDRGQLIIEVGLAPVKPAEFVIFRFSQWASGGA